MVAFYVGAALLVITSLFTMLKVKEYDPATYALYHGIEEADNQKGESWLTLLKHAPKAFWTVTLVQFFCWFAFQYLWTYSAGAIAQNVWHTTNATSAAYQAAGNWYGVLAAVQSIAAVVWSYVLAKVPNQYHKLGYGGQPLDRGHRVRLNFLRSQPVRLDPFLRPGRNCLGRDEHLPVDGRDQRP